VAKQHKEEAKQAYEAKNKYNEIESRARMQEALLEHFKRQQSAPAPQAPPSDEEFLQQFAQRPTQVLPQTIQQYVAPLQQQMQVLQYESLQARAEAAREMARTKAGLDEPTWNELRQPIASFMLARGADPTNPMEWVASLDMYKKLAPKFVTRAEVAQPAAPPAGQARSVSRPSSAPRLSARDERNLADLAEASGIKKGTPAWDRLVSEIANGGAA
jgi:hypothetical protein